MKKEYYSGDVIEIVTSEYKNASEHDKAGNNPRRKCKDFIGQRFVLDRVYEDYFVSVNFGDERYKETFFIKQANCILYRRSLINRIKSLLPF